MVKEMAEGKNMIMTNQHLKENIYLIRDGMEKDIMRKVMKYMKLNKVQVQKEDTVLIIN